MKALTVTGHICFALTVLTVLGCSGGVINTTIRPAPTPNVKFVPAENTIYLSEIRTVAVFPFADYSHQQDMLGIDTWGGNIKIQEEITDQLLKHGLSVVVQEDINTLLVDHDIIRPIDDDKYLIHGTVHDRDEPHTWIATPEHELANYTHSADMTMEIMDIIARKNRSKKPRPSKSPVLQGASVGLSREKVVELADILSADLIIRGRIIDYGYRDVGTMNPLYRGVVPVVIDSVRDLLFGATGGYGYEEGLNDDIENMLIGSALGYMIGNNVIDRSTSTHSSVSRGLVSRRVSRSDVDHDDNAVEGAIIGGAAGWLASQHPKKAKRSAVVQVRVYAQDGETGEVLWSNRAEIEYTPKSNFAYAETHPKKMFDTAVKEGVKTLMDSFFAETENVFLQEYVPVQKEGA